MKEVTDPTLLEELNKKEVTDPALLAQLEGTPLPQKQPPKSYALGQVPGAAISNILPQFYEYAKTFVNPQTYIGMGNLISSAMPGSWLTNFATRGTLPYQEIAETAKALGEQKAESYGGWENIKRTVAERPLEPIQDIASMLMLGGKFIPGQLGSMATKTGQWMEPTTAVGQGLNWAVPYARGLISGPLGISTGGGKIPIEKAMEGGQTFKTALRGGIAGEEAVETAKGGIHALRQEQVNTYKTRLQAIKQATITPTMDVMVPMREFTDQLKNFNVKLVRSPNGRISGLDFTDSDLVGNMKAQGDFNKMMDILRNAYDKPGFYKNPEGYDILKRQLYDLYSESSQGRAAVERVAGSVRKELINKVPGYETMVSDYEKSTKLIREIERDLTLGKKGSVDTALRKLNSAMREDDDFRRGLIKEVSKGAGKDIEGMISGRLLSTWMPKSWMGREIAAGTVFASIFGNPAILPALATASPRLVAETLILLGKGKEAGRVLSSAGLAPERQIIQQTGKAVEKEKE